MKKIKPNLSATLLIAFGIIIIILGFLFFMVDPARKEIISKPAEINII